MNYDVGTPALTSRGFKEDDFKTVMKFLDEAVTLALHVQQNTGMFNTYV